MSLEISNCLSHLLQIILRVGFGFPHLLPAWLGSVYSHITWPYLHLMNIYVVEFCQELLAYSCRPPASSPWLLTRGNGPVLSLEEAVLENQPALLDSSSLQDDIPWDCNCPSVLSLLQISALSESSMRTRASKQDIFSSRPEEAWWSAASFLSHSPQQIPTPMSPAVVCQPAQTHTLSSGSWQSSMHACFSLIQDNCPCSSSQAILPKKPVQSHCSTLVMWVWFAITLRFLKILASSTEEFEGEWFSFFISLSNCTGNEQKIHFSVPLQNACVMVRYVLWCC